VVHVDLEDLGGASVTVSAVGHGSINRLDEPLQESLERSRPPLDDELPRSLRHSLAQEEEAHKAAQQPQRQRLPEGNEGAPRVDLLALEGAWTARGGADG